MVICYSPPDFSGLVAREFSLISHEKRNYLLLAIHWFGIYLHTKTIIHLSVGKEWQISTKPQYPPLFTSISVNNCFKTILSYMAGWKKFKNLGKV